MKRTRRINFHPIALLAIDLTLLLFLGICGCGGSGNSQSDLGEPGSTAGGPDWICVSETSPWISRDSAGHLVFQDEMWLIGGYTPSLLGDVWHSADGLNWTRATDIPEPAGIDLPIQGIMAGEMLIVANNGALYESSDGISWKQQLPIMPTGKRNAAGSIVFNNRFWVLGGYEYKEDENDVLHNDVWSSSDGMVWRREAENAGWEPRQLFNAVVNFNGKMWIIGGGYTSYYPFIAYNDVWSSLDGVQWQKELASAPWEKRVWHSATVYKNRIWLLGGYQSEPESKNLGDVWYSCNGKDWKKLETEHSWSPRHAMSVYVYKDRMWIAGGNPWPLENDVWSLNIPALIFITTPEVRGQVGVPYSYYFDADFNGSCGPISYELVSGPSWLNLDTNDQTLTGIPSSPGDYFIKLRAFDGAETVDQEFVISVE
jgi:hypothetical protein